MTQLHKYTLTIPRCIGNKANRRAVPGSTLKKHFRKANHYFYWGYFINSTSALFFSIVVSFTIRTSHSGIFTAKLFIFHVFLSLYLSCWCQTKTNQNQNYVGPKTVIFSTQQRKLSRKNTQRSKNSTKMKNINKFTILPETSCHACVVRISFVNLFLRFMKPFSILI